jgi:hypothetical protein
MDPIKPKQEPEDTTNLKDIPPADTIAGSDNAAANNDAKNPENAEANTAVDKKLENAINKKYLSIEEADEGIGFTVEEAIEFTARLRRGDNDPTKAKDPIVLARENFTSLAGKLSADLANLSIDDRAPREAEVFNAEEDYKEKLAEQKALVKEQRRKDLQEQIDKEEDESALYDAISEGKVWAKLKVGYTECAMVELRAKDKTTGEYDERASCYQVFDADLVDQRQLANAPNYNDIRPKKISRAQASLAFAVAYRGGPDTLQSTFDIEDFLAKKLPKKSSDGVVPRESRRTIWMMGDLEVPEKGPDGKLVHPFDKIWMMPRSNWEGMKPSQDKKKIYQMGVGRAIRQFRNYHNALELEAGEFEPEKTPFNRADSESANDWRLPKKTPEPEGTPDREFSEEPVNAPGSNPNQGTVDVNIDGRASSMVTERGTPAPVSGGGPNTQDDQDYEAMSL